MTVLASTVRLTILLRISAWVKWHGITGSSRLPRVGSRSHLAVGAVVVILLLNVNGRQL